MECFYYASSKYCGSPCFINQGPQSYFVLVPWGPCEMHTLTQTQYHRIAVSKIKNLQYYSRPLLVTSVDTSPFVP